MKLKPIPAKTVVHTTTEAEAKELLAILHENEYKLWNGRNLLEISGGFAHRMKAVVIRPNQGEVDWYDNIANAPESITLAEFKAKYCEGEKPQPKFKVGDKVRIIQDDSVNPAYVGIVDEIVSIGYRIQLKNTDSNWSENVLEPYTEPETKPTEEMEENKKEQNLCELLKGHKGETFWSPVFGDLRLSRIDTGDNKPLLFEWEEGHVFIYPDGKMYSGTLPIVYPSRALYEQYPLDPQKAWMKWQEEQELRILRIILTAPDLERDYVEVDFRTPADRDKCISEIKAIIEKYSKK